VVRGVRVGRGEGGGGGGLMCMMCCLSMRLSRLEVALGAFLGLVGEGVGCAALVCPLRS
jgi:hypothetical protein